MDKTILIQLAYAFFIGISIVAAAVLYWYLCFGDKNLSWGLSSSELQQIPIFLHSVRATTAAAAVAPGCLICLDEFRRGDECRRMPECGHLFHAHCVDRWLLESRTCPTCRACVTV